MAKTPRLPGKCCICYNAVEAMGLEPTNLLTASQALYQLSYAPEVDAHVIRRRDFHDSDSRASIPLTLNGGPTTARPGPKGA